MKKGITTAILIMLTSAAVFANGSSEYGPGRAGQTVTPETMSGTFLLADGQYPALVTADQTWYLHIRFPVDSQSIPEDGDSLTVEAFPSPASPVHLNVVSAQVNGVDITPAFETQGSGTYGRPGGGPGGPGGRGNGTDRRRAFGRGW